MRDYLLSLQLVRRVIQHGNAIVVGVIGGLLGIVSGIYGDMNPKSAPLIPVWLWLTLIAAGTLAAITCAFHDVRLERDREDQNDIRPGVQGDGNVVIEESAYSRADVHVTKPRLRQ